MLLELPEPDSDAVDVVAVLVYGDDELADEADDDDDDLEDVADIAERTESAYVVSVIK